MGPCVPILTLAECTVRVLEFDGPEDVFPVVTHVSSISKF